MADLLEKSIEAFEMAYSDQSTVAATKGDEIIYSQLEIMFSFSRGPMNVNVNLAYCRFPLKFSISGIFYLYFLLK